MKVISITNQKGGCGKTITAVNLAGALAKQGKKTLLLDLDPQSHATFSLGYKNYPAGKDILAVFDNILQDAPITPQNYILERKENLFFIPSTIELSAIEQELSGSKYALEIIQKFTSSLPAADWDFVIIDCPPNLGFLTINAIRACDIIITPVDISAFSLLGIDNLKKISSVMLNHNEKDPRQFYLITIFDKRSNFSKNFIKTINKHIPRGLLKTIIRNNIHLREAALLGKTIFEHNPKSNGAKDYSRLAEEITQKTKNINAVEFSLKAPSAQSVFLVGDFTNWRKDERFALVNKNGIWKKKVNLKKGRYRYKFIIDEQWVWDKNNPLNEDDTFGSRNSIVEIN